MNEKALNTLEFNKIKERLEGYANSPMGKHLVKELLPSVDINEIEQNLLETDAALLRLGLHGNISFSGVRDVNDSLKRLDIAASLSIPELLQISGVLTAAGRAKAYARDSEKAPEEKKPVPRAVRLNAHYTKNQPDPEKLRDTVGKERILTDSSEPLKAARLPQLKIVGSDDSLSGYFRDIEPLSPVNKEITRCILSEDTVADDASAGLFSVRKKKHVYEERIHTSLNSILNSSRSMLQDAVITMRDGRYCLPVKAEYKSSFQGMVHDQSSTGSTLFIEPMSIVKLNNDIKELEAEEKKEIEKVLEALSGSLMPHTETIRNDIAILAHLDFVFAKAKFAESMHATMPKLNDKYYISILNGRHPLIDPRKVVPTTVYLGKDFDMLVITGPNTGGKTVCLKTIGLFQLMGQSGLFIPASEGSELSVFEEIFADIGDEQSIEQSLSTFSAHMTNTVKILEKADSHSLCLFDELGAGTDPTEGAALAMAILNFLHNMKTRTVATTHYAEIKVYALSTPGVENASCEFDVTTLSPTYRLLIGIPGKSNAFAISQKLGLPGYIIDDAKSRLEKEDVKFEDVIASLEESRVTIEREKQEIERYKAEIEEYKRRARENSKGVEKGRDKILQKAREEASQILQDAKETADSIVKELRRQEQNGAATLEAEKTRSALNKKLKDTQASMSVSQKIKGPSKPVSAKSLRIGDTVHVASMDINATVSTLPDHKGELYVTAGIIRTKVSVRDIELVDTGKVTGPGLENMGRKKKGSTSGGDIRMQKTMGISPEINLIGMTTAEAIPELQKYLDDAYLSHIPQARVVHGRGTGALRKAVHQQLKKLKYVESFRLGEFGEGQDGVTIVFFKK